MNTKKKRIMCMVAISGIFLLFYVCIWRGYRTFTMLDIVVSEEGVQDIRLIQQKIPFGKQAQPQSDEYVTLSVSWRDELANGGSGLFLPAFVDLHDVYAGISYEDGAQKVQFDEILLGNEAIQYLGTVEEGTHVITVGEEELELRIMKGSRLPSIWIATDESMDYIHADKENTTSGTIKIISAYGNTEYEEEMQSLKGRGNSSWSMAKKSYAMKLATQAPLLGMSSGKSWVLSGNGGDVTGLRNKLFYDMAIKCGLKNAVESKWVDLYINNEYYGCYLLTEKIDIASGRLEIGNLEEQTELLNGEPVESYPYYVFEEDGKHWSGYSVPTQPSDMSGGYLLEIEEYKDRFLAEPSRFSTEGGHYVVVKSPAHATLAQVEYISAFVQEFEDAIYSEDGCNALGTDYSQYIDMESFAVRYLIDEISKNVDAGYSSYFFYKPWNEKKLYAGPVWDYDTSLGNNLDWGDSDFLQNPEGMYANSANWSKALWEKPEFQALTKEIYHRRFQPYLEYLTEEGLDEYIRTIRDSMAMESACYGEEEWDEEVARLRDFLQKRMAFLEKELQ